MKEANIENSDIALGDAEIASIIEASKKASYQKSQTAPARDTKNFTARKLVDIAFEAEAKRTTSLQEENSEATIENEKIALSSANASPIQNTAKLADKENISEDPEKTQLKDSIKKLEEEISSHAENTELKIKLAEEKGYSRGLNEGMTKTEQKLKAQLDEKIKIFTNFLISFSEISNADFSKINDSIEKAVKRIAEDKIQHELGKNPEFINLQIEKLSKMIVNASSQPLVRINSGEYDIVQPYLNKKGVNYNIVKDPNLSPGDIVLEVGAIEIRDLLDERITANPITFKDQIADYSTGETPPTDLKPEEPQAQSEATSETPPTDLKPEED